MNGTNDPYFDWLCILVKAKEKGYSLLAKSLHECVFRPKLKMDANRGGDGLQLRVEFQREHGPWGSSVNRGPCTMLEFLIGLAKRMNFLMYGEDSHRHTEYYFWKMTENMGLKKVTDDNWYALNGDFFVEDAVARVNERLYTGSGAGGIFPLRHPQKDQRSVEIWYQMNAWLMENSDVGDL